MRRPGATPETGVSEHDSSKGGFVAQRMSLEATVQLACSRSQRTAVSQVTTEMPNAEPRGFSFWSKDAAQRRIRLTSAQKQDSGVSELSLGLRSWRGVEMRRSKRRAAIRIGLKMYVLQCRYRIGGGDSG
jgi:hypothetical protein